MIYSQLKRWLTTFFLFFLIVTIQAQDINIGIITDFRSGNSRHVDFVQFLKNEIQKTLGTSTNVTIADQNILTADWDENKAAAMYETLSDKCDYIILVGSISTNGILRRGALPKPTIAIGISNIEIQGIPMTEDGTSGIHNFSYVLTSRDFEKEATQFKELVDFKKLAFLVHEEASSAINQDEAIQQVQRVSEKLDCEIFPIQIGSEVDESLRRMPSDIDAVIVATTYELDEEQIADISNFLTDRKLPSYSLVKQHVELGILFSISSDNGFESLIRKVAIMIDDVDQGADLANLSVTLDVKEQLFLNIETAQKIDHSPSFRTIFTAKLIGDRLANSKEIYSLEEILSKTLEENLSIKISRQDLALSVQDVKNARSNYFPTLDIEFQGAQVNEKSANELTGQSERSLTETGSLGQLIYSEQVIASIKIQKLLNEAQQHATQQEINNTILDAYSAYFNVLFAKSNVIIQTENLEVFKKNLELAQIRARIGSSTNSDLYRWEAEVANATQSVIEAQTDLILAKTQLNTLLNNTLPEEFEVEDVSLTDDIYSFFSNNVIAKTMNGPDDIRSATTFLTAEALKNYPARLQLGINLSAVDRQLKMNERLFYTPSLGLGASQKETLARGGAASTPTMGEFVNSTWNVGLSLTYPIFDGTRRKIEKQRTLIQKSQLGYELNNLDNNLGLNVQTSVIGLLTSQTNIHYSEITATNSWRNFELTQDYYRQGSVSIVQLFDAQNSALQAKLGYVNSVYNYLLSFVSLENLIGFYSMLGTEAERLNFENKYLENTQTSSN